MYNYDVIFCNLSKAKYKLVIFFEGVILAMIKDDIFSLILKYRLPVTRNSQTIKDFLNCYYKEYIDALENAVYSSNNEQNTLQSQFYSTLNDKIPIIKEQCNDIIKTLELYDGSNILLLYKHFDEMMEKIKAYLGVEYLGLNGNARLKTCYRIRGGDSEYSRLDLFHIPMFKRNLIRSYRYSIPGYPCLYLSTGLELCWFECGMPKKFSYSAFQLQNDENIKLINFNIQSNELVSSVPIWYANNPEDKNKIDEYVLKYLIIHPLRVACSVQVSERNNAFIQEYIIPQLLLLWVRKNNDFDGIAYSSCSAIGKAHEWNYCNVVFPAKDLKNGYCKRLSGLFKITKPVKVEMCHLFESWSSKIEEVRNFVGQLEYRYYNGKSLYLYKEILSLCKSVLILFNCLLADNYYNAEAIYQTMDTLNLMWYIIKENTETFSRRAVDEFITLYPDVGKQQIENEFLEVVNYFSNKVEPILFELWDYISRVRGIFKIDFSTLEYVNKQQVEI